MVLGKHSGSHAVVRALQSLGLDAEPSDVAEILRQLRSFAADAKRSPTDNDLRGWHARVVSGRMALLGESVP